MKKIDCTSLIINFSLKEIEIRNIKIIDKSLELGEIEDLSSIKPIKPFSSKPNPIDNINLVEKSSPIKLKIKNIKKENKK